MLRELASGASHIDPDTFGLMNAVYVAVRDIIVQGQREGTFRDVDPLLVHLTIMPAVLIFFARQRASSPTTSPRASASRAPSTVRAHMQEAVRRILRNDS